MCKTKWLNLKKEYANWLDTQTRTGAERKEFVFADLMGDILRDSSHIKPKVLGTQSGFVGEGELILILVIVFLYHCFHIVPCLYL